MESPQKNAFINYEADNYFKRNKNVEYNSDQDPVFKVLKEYAIIPRHVLEVGCNSGYRLNAILKEYNCPDVAGIEPSHQAITEGMSSFPKVKFVQGTADDMSSFKSGHFDLIIIGFVFYVVDREIIFKVVSEVDRLLANGGLLMIIDFFSEKPIKNPYKHITDVEAFTFKQNYDEIFTSSKIYHLLDKRSLSHESKIYDASADFYNKYSIVTLKKDVVAAYK